jgi:hypothetical protein
MEKILPNKNVGFYQGITPCMGVMTYNALAFSASKHLGSYCWFYTISFENPKSY